MDGWRRMGTATFAAVNCVTAMFASACRALSVCALAAAEKGKGRPHRRHHLRSRPRHHRQTSIHPPHRHRSPCFPSHHHLRVDLVHQATVREPQPSVRVLQATDPAPPSPLRRLEATLVLHNLRSVPLLPRSNLARKFPPQGTSTSAAPPLAKNAPRVRYSAICTIPSRSSAVRKLHLGLMDPGWPQGSCR